MSAQGSSDAVPDDATDTASGSLDDGFRAALAELEEFLVDAREEELAALVLPLASRWVVSDVGLDLGRLRDEAAVFVDATPMSERILVGYSDHLSYWLSQRMLVDADETPRPELASTQLERAREEILSRAELVEAEGFPRIGEAFRRLLDETAGGEPPADLVWSALALRIAESVLP